MPDRHPIRPSGLESLDFMFTILELLTTAPPTCMDAKPLSAYGRSATVAERLWIQPSADAEQHGPSDGNAVITAAHTHITNFRKPPYSGHPSHKAGSFSMAGFFE